MIIQYIATGIILIIFGQLAFKVIRDKASFVKILFWLSFWSIALVLIWLPKEIFDSLGDIVGVGRGIDALVYLSIIILFYTNLRLNSRLDKLEKNITKLVREIAKSNAKK
ncbi:DUF2304 family protein [Candidatus Dojkabacteria bacterium]|uniref:DUF2304 family protein n=1 Tax=Candidatus Dojkabacteria bacterium TaxID=2099670 RepID=A0A847VDV8_9BACT|nr:DUF2304 family protein [Candidatus Dojkabacteria bacterium]